MSFQSTALTAVILALATPYITLIGVPLALSAVFAVLALTFFAKQDIKSSDYIVIANVHRGGTHTPRPHTRPPGSLEVHYWA
jgi:hypothetical protein